MSIYRWFAVLGAAFSMMLCSAHAQNGESEDAVEAVLACQLVQDNEARLSCLDKAVKNLAVTRIVEEDDAAAESSAPALDADLPGVTESEAKPSGDFGRDSLPYSKRDDVKKRPKKLSVKIVEIKINQYGKFTALLENGQVWRQLNSDTKRIVFSNRDRLYTATLKRGLMGNYMMTIEELGRTARVKRTK